MELQPSFSVSGLSGQRAAGDGGPPEVERLAEATVLVRRTRLRLEELANRLSQIRERIQKGAEPASRPEDAAVAGSSGQLG